MNILDHVEQAEIAANKAVEEMAIMVEQLRGVKLKDRSYDSYQRIVASNMSDEYTYAENTRLVQASFYWTDEDDYNSYYVYFPESYLEYNTWQIAERQVIEADVEARKARQEYRHQQELNRKREMYELLRAELGYDG